MRFRPAQSLALTALVLLLGAASAQAGPLVASATGCEPETYEQPFLPWADVANYVLAPDGTFESGAASWTLGGAAVGAGNEPFYVHGAGESASLALPDGSSATTRAVCVGIEHPTIRFFARNGGLPQSTLQVEVLFEDATGGVHAAAIGVVTSDGSWQPTPPLPIVVNLLPLLPGERTAVAFRFTPQGTGGSWEIDDLYVDPWRGR